MENKTKTNMTNKMTLWMVTYEGDLTQFGVTEESDVENRKLYIADPVDFALLREIMRREDYYGDVCDTVVYNG